MTKSRMEAFSDVVLLFAAVAYYILVRSLIFVHGKDSTLAAAVGRDFKGKVSLVAYAAAIPVAFLSSMVACGMYVIVAVMWLIPDRRIERTLAR